MKYVYHNKIVFPVELVDFIYMERRNILHRIYAFILFLNQTRYHSLQGKRI